MTADDFRTTLAELFKASESAGRSTVIVRAGVLHRLIGGYPGSNHRMLICCDVMYAEMTEGADEIIVKPQSGTGASLTIEYRLPRPARN